MTLNNFIKFTPIAVVLLLLNSESYAGQYNMMGNNMPRYNQNVGYNNGVRYNTLPQNTAMYGQYAQQQRNPQLLQNNIAPMRQQIMYQNRPANSYVQPQNNQVVQNQFRTNNNVPLQNNNTQSQTNQNNNNKQSPQVTTQQTNNNNISTQLSNIQKVLNTISSQLNTIINNVNLKGTTTTPQQLNKNIQTSQGNAYINTGAAVANAIIPGSGTVVKAVASNKNVQNVLEKTATLAPTLSQIIKS